MILALGIAPENFYMWTSPASAAFSSHDVSILLAGGLFAYGHHIPRLRGLPSRCKDHDLRALHRLGVGAERLIARDVAPRW